MKEELHLFIIWHNGRKKQEYILEDINKNFEILEIYEIEWNKEEFSNNLSRFYGTKLPDGSNKAQHCGNGKFLLIIVKVINPIYEKRITNKGEKIVNTNIFDKKIEYRNLEIDGDTVHATNDEVETNHDLTLLLGKNIKDFLKENKEKKWNGQIKEIKRDLMGTEKWNSVSEMFYVMNNCLNYAILRNYESLPNEIYENDHNDIDIICDSLEEARYILNAEPVFKEEYRVHYKTQVENRIAYFDLRHVGDNYYYENMEIKILKEKIYNEKGFYTLNEENYFYSLLYHALIHKDVFKNDYKEKLERMNIKKVNKNTTIEEYAQILKDWMINQEFIIVEPIDKTVMLNLNNVEYFKPLVYREKVIFEDKTQINILYEENERLREENKKLKTTIEAIKDSRTWKITEPIRKLKKKIKKI